MNFPALVFRCPGKHQRAGGTYDHKAVMDGDEKDAALADGWFSTLPEAIDGKAKDEDNAAPTRDELETKAKELGIKFDGRTTDTKLGKLITEALDS